MLSTTELATWLGCCHATVYRVLKLDMSAADRRALGIEKVGAGFVIPTGALPALRKLAAARRARAGGRPRLHAAGEGG